MRLGMIFWVFCIFLGVPYGAEAFSWSDDADEIVGRHGTPQEYSEKKDDTRSLWASAMSMGRISPAFGCEKGIVSYAYWDGPGDYVSTQKTFFFEWFLCSVLPHPMLFGGPYRTSQCIWGPTCSKNLSHTTCTWDPRSKRQS